MNVLSLFSGVGGFDLGLERAGMTTVAQCEWDAKCQQVLAGHWPDVPRWGDVSDVNGSDLPDCDLVAFGSPCQDLSVAGKRAGMVEGETRSGLFYEAVRIIKELQDDGRAPAWAIWENVAGALSSNSGRDFAAVLDSLGDLGAVDLQWRVLDAQFFGVAQRRRRVFLVARLDPGAAGRREVLPVGASVRRDSPPGSPPRRRSPTGDDSGAPVVAFDSTWSGAFGVCIDVSPPLKLGNGTVPAIVREGLARRCTPRECERLMGWPDDWTRYAADGTEIADGNRYRMIGNGVASPVAEWVGRCILKAA